MSVTHEGGSGIGSQVGWMFGNVINAVGFSSEFFSMTVLRIVGRSPCQGILQIGFAYAMGIVFAVAVCGGTSGGHFNPCVTITLCVFKGFPKAKALR